MAAVILILFGVVFFSLLTCVFCYIRARYRNREAFTGAREQSSFSKGTLFRTSLTHQPKQNITFLAHLKRAFLIARCPLSVCLSFCQHFTFFFFFSRTLGPISTKLGTKYPWVKGIQICTNEGPWFIQSGDNNENTFTKFENVLLQNHLANFYHTWHKANLGEGNSNKGPF